MWSLIATFSDNERLLKVDGLSIRAISSDLEGHSPAAGFIKCNSANICVAFDSFN